MSRRETKRREFLMGAGIGAVALIGSAKVQADGWTDVERANVKTVTDFCAAWATRDLTRVLPFLTADCVYRMTETTAPANGHEGVSARLKTYVEGSTEVEFRVLDTFAAGPIVINHRIDRFVSSSPLTWEGVGVFFVKDGKIKEWSDYTIRTQR